MRKPKFDRRTSLSSDAVVAQRQVLSKIWILKSAATSSLLEYTGSEIFALGISQTKRQIAFMATLTLYKLGIYLIWFFFQHFHNNFSLLLLSWCNVLNIFYIADFVSNSTFGWNCTRKLILLKNIPTYKNSITIYFFQFQFYYIILLKVNFLIFREFEIFQKVLFKKIQTDFSKRFLIL